MPGVFTGELGHYHAEIWSESKKVLHFDLSF